METPLISIIIPTFNREHFLGETLSSIKNQTYQNWECLIIDDGSTDNTKVLVSSYVGNDTRFKYFMRPDNLPKGANSCRNFGFELSNGLYINWVDSDDLLAPDKIELQLNGLLEVNGEVATCKWGRFRDSNDFALKELAIYQNYSRGTELLVAYGQFSTFFPSHAFLVKRELVYRSGLWNEHLKINQDGEFFSRVLINAHNVVCVNNTYVLYRLPVAGNTSHNITEEKAKHLVWSWILIDTSLKIIEPHLFDQYLDSGKQYCFHVLKDRFADVLQSNRWFFKKEFYNNSIFSRIKKKLL